MCNKGINSACCCTFSVISAVIAAVGIAAIFYAGLITSVAALLWITLILGILGLLYIIFKAFCGGRKIKNPCVIVSIIGSIVTSIFALTATALATFSIATALLIGAVAFFLVSTLFYLVDEVVEKIGYGSYED